jgi:dATP/dGTP diphosphohydrolase
MSNVFTGTEAMSIELTEKITEALRPGDDIHKQGVKFDNGKTRLDLVPPEGVLAVADILAVGAKKYAARNWEQGMEWSRPYAAAQRHLYAWWGGEDRDPDTNKSHLWHACCNLFFLIAYEARGKGTDDRPLI